LENNKILWLSDSAATTTGYSTISLNILNSMEDRGWDTTWLSHNYAGQTIPKKGLKFMDDTVVNSKILSAGREAYCKDVLLPMIQQEQPNIFGILLDTFMLYPWILSYNFSPAKSMFYFPTDGGGGLPLGCENIIRKVDNPIAMSRFGRKQVKDVHKLDVEYIPHAVDHRLFHKLPDEEIEKLKQEFVVYDINNIPVKGVLAGKFVIGCVSRNQGRKMLDRGIKTMMLLAEKCPNAIMLLHMDAFDNAAVFNMNELIRRHGLQNKVCYTGMKFYSTFTYEKMNEIYNIMDIHFLPTSGEGFGIPLIECQACEVPPIATDYTTSPELIMEDGQSGEMINLQTELTGNWNVERGVCDINDAVAKVKKLYDDPDLVKEYGRIGRKKVEKLYTWDVVNKKWDSLFRRMVEY